MSTKQIDTEIEKYVDAQGAYKEGIPKRFQKEKKRLGYYRIKNNLRTKDLIGIKRENLSNAGFGPLSNRYMYKKLYHRRCSFLENR